jgi:hypothetical protein
MLYRFLQTRIVQLESYDGEGIKFRTDFKPQFRVVRWFDFKYRDEAGIKRSEKFATADAARTLLKLKTGATPNRKQIVTVVE